VTTPTGTALANTIQQGVIKTVFINARSVKSTNAPGLYIILQMKDRKLLTYTIAA